MTRPSRSRYGLAVLSCAVWLALAPGAGLAQTAPAALPEHPAAEAGDAAAQLALALRYHKGDGVAQNFASAAIWLTRAAEQGNPQAQNLLGQYFHSGFGMKKDQAQALRWLSMAAKSGDAQFLHDLARALENGADGSSDPAKAAEIYAASAAQGHLDSKVSLGVLLQAGKGVPQDYARARALYAEAAEQGHARAQNNLGLLYVRGHGVPQDYAHAVKLFTKAAEQGLPIAMTNLGVMYENGFGVPFDEARAAELYRAGGQSKRSDGAQSGPRELTYDARLAPPPKGDDALNLLQQMAQAGDPIARYQLAYLLASPKDAPFPALRNAASLFEKAARSGYGPAMYNLGILHFEGRGVIQDYTLGLMWLTLADAAGQHGAAQIGLSYRDVMTADQINQAQALAAKLRAQMK